jgi:DNA-binding CsgD family transcriptional regulator
MAIRSPWPVSSRSSAGNRACTCRWGASPTRASWTRSWLTTPCARGGPLYLCERTKTIFRHGAARAGFIAGEEDVLRFLVKGDCNKGIARKLNISANTVKAHVSRLCEKLHVASRVQVAVKATQRGLVRV